MDAASRLLHDQVSPCGAIDFTSVIIILTDDDCLNGAVSFFEARCTFALASGATGAMATAVIHEIAAVSSHRAALWVVALQVLVVNIVVDELPGRLVVVRGHKVA